MDQKGRSEVWFWRNEIQNYIRWYEGGEPLYGRASPTPAERIITGHGQPADALETWLQRFQMPKYLHDLGLEPHSLLGRRVLDIGCGPFPNLLAFTNCTRFGIDPLIAPYAAAGFPLKRWSHDFTYLAARAEAIPLPAASIDAVISVNAIDHVDDFAQVAREVQRILCPGGFFRMHVHYHPRTVFEPMELDDAIFLQHYAWLPGLRKLSQSDRKDMGGTVANPGERYVVWGN